MRLDDEADMRLVRCTVVGFPSAVEYGKRAFSHDATEDHPALSRAEDYHRRVVIGELVLETYDGTIIEFDDEGEEVFVTLRATDGSEREFERYGDPARYEIGYRMVVRYVVLSRTRHGFDLWYPMEVWVGPPPDVPAEK